MASSQSDEDVNPMKGKGMTRGPSKMKDHVRMRDQGVKLVVKFNVRVRKLVIRVKLWLLGLESWSDMQSRYILRIGG